MKSKPQRTMPTIDEFLSFIPLRVGYEWTVDDEGFVHITVPKFQGKWGTRLCRVLRRTQTFTADMDRLGSIVWLQCNGKNTVKDILEEVKKEYTDENELDQRLFLFLQQMKNLNYLLF